MTFSIFINYRQIDRNLDNLYQIIPHMSNIDQVYRVYDQAAILGFIFQSGIWAHPALRAGPGYPLQQKRLRVFVPLLSLARACAHFMRTPQGISPVMPPKHQAVFRIYTTILL
jgi:hypothetical protein